MKPEDYKFHSSYDLIPEYKDVKNPDEWEYCEICGAIPKVWEYDNGRYASCMCHNTRYDNFTVRAESVMSIVTRNNGSAEEYNIDELRINWNHFVRTGEHLFPQNTKGLGVW